MPIHIEYTSTFSDYLSAQRLHAKRSAWSRFNDLGVRVLSPVLGTVILLLALLISGPGVSWTGPFVFMIACAVILLIYPLNYRYRLKSCYERTRIADGARRFDFHQETIQTQEGHTRSELDWSAVQLIRENKEVMMLYVAPAKFLLIPKRASFSHQIDEVRQLCLSKAIPIKQF
jgi:hypothetical protein